MSKPRTVTRFIEQRVTLGQIAYEAYRLRAGILCAWSDLDDESRAEWEAAAEAVVEAVEDTRADEPPVQRIEKKSLTIDELNDLIKNVPEDTSFYLVPNTPSDPRTPQITGWTTGTYEERPVAKVSETATTPARRVEPETAFSAVGVKDGALVAMRDIKAGEVVGFTDEAFKSLERVFGKKREVDAAMTRSILGSLTDSLDPTRGKYATPLPPSAFPSEPFIPSDS